jgi:hypothetical protein
MYLRIYSHPLLQIHLQYAHKIECLGLIIFEKAYPANEFAVTGANKFANTNREVVLSRTFVLDYS